MENLSFNQFISLGWPQPLSANFENDAIISLSRKNSISNDWLAFPLEWQISMPGTEYTSRLQSYCSHHQIKQIVGFSPCFLSPNSPSEILIGEGSAENFLKIQSTFALRAYTVIPDNGDFQVFSDGDYYTILSGQKKFLELTLGVNANDAILRFKKYVSSYVGDDIEHKHVAQILESCENFNSGNKQPV